MFCQHNYVSTLTAMGTYADKNGFEECITCPYRLASTNGSRTCSFCAKGFYLNNNGTTINPLDILQDPFTYCKECPFGASCEANSTLSQLDILPDYWRHSNRTSTIYKCSNNNGSCNGSTETTYSKENMELHSFGDTYCNEGHKGPLCQVCEDKRSYFSDTDGQCMKCPSSGTITVFLLVILSSVTVAATLIAYFFIK